MRLRRRDICSRPRQARSASHRDLRHSSHRRQLGCTNGSNWGRPMGQALPSSLGMRQRRRYPGIRPRSRPWRQVHSASHRGLRCSRRNHSRRTVRHTPNLFARMDSRVRCLTAVSSHTTHRWLLHSRTALPLRTTSNNPDSRTSSSRTINACRLTPVRIHSDNTCAQPAQLDTITLVQWVQLIFSHLTTPR